MCGPVRKPPSVSNCGSGAHLRVMSEHSRSIARVRPEVISNLRPHYKAVDLKVNRTQEESTFYVHWLFYVFYYQGMEREMSRS